MSYADDPLSRPLMLVFEPMSDPDGIDPAIRYRHLLKRAKRDWYLKCVGMGPAPGDNSQPEVARLRQLVAGMAERIAAQAEALARRAERKEGSTP